MTYSVVARDAAAGELGVAAATALPAVGALVPHVRGGVGAVATQGWATNPFYGPDGLAALARGEAPEAALAALTAADPGRDHRQAIMIDARGRTAGWTGAENIREMAHLMAADIAVAGNMLRDATALDAMLGAFAAAAGAPLAERLMAALRAAEAAGGDRRGTCSAALLVESGRGYPDIDLRVDHHARPLGELARLLVLRRELGLADFLERLPRRR
jgi:uncharacterized Ntn-hydrolase superfamily protein